MSDQSKDEELIQEITGGKFAKVFNLEESQLLVQWDYEPAEDTYFISLDFKIEGIRASLRLDGFKNIENCLKGFENIDKSNAEKFYDSLTRQADGDAMNLILS